MNKSQNSIRQLTDKRQNLGFTLIELLVVISVIGILASVIFARLATAEKSARDAKRKSDLNQYRTALESYAAINAGTYRSRWAESGVRASTTLCTDLGTNYLGGCPEDPIYGVSGFEYKYQSNGSGGGASDATQYVLWGQMEAVTGFWVICSTGKVGVLSSVSVASGGCPL